jgi:hypothetical protein
MSSHKLAGYASHYDQSVRLCILKALNEQVDGRLNDHVLSETLRDFAFTKGRSYTLNQLQYLADEVGAVNLTHIGSVVVAEITEDGVDHVERRRVLSGVAKPSAAQRR